MRNRSISSEKIEYKTEPAAYDEVETLINFESNIDKSKSSEIILPIIDPSIKDRLGDEHLDLLWDTDQGKVRPTKDSFYVPALLAFYGWHLDGDYICKFC